MTNGLYTTAVGLVPQMYKQEVIANNLANINTVGYKKDGIYFQRILEGEMFSRLDLGDDEFIPQVKKIATNFQQGSLISTRNQLDFALSGEGFFVIQTPQGMAYTRNGNFTMNPDGLLVTNLGYPVLGEDGEIELKEIDSFQVTAQGEILLNGEKTNKFRVMKFDQPEALEKTGNNLFRIKAGFTDGIELETAVVKQGYLEQSNVKVSEEMVEMLMTLRRFEAMQRTIKMHNETILKAVNELGRGK